MRFSGSWGLRLVGVGLIVVSLASEILSRSNNGLGPLQLGVLGLGLALIGVSFLRLRGLGQLLAIIIIPVLAILLLEVILLFAGIRPAYGAEIFAHDPFLPLNPSTLCDEGVGCRMNTEYIRTQETCTDERICNVNSEGYNDTNEFVSSDDLDTTQARILLLGDSFTWGLSADVGQGWAERLKAHLEPDGFVVWNTGITASGTNQALGIAERYLSILKPSVVVLGFYMGNDFRDNLYPMGSWLTVQRDGKTVKLNRYTLDVNLVPRLMSDEELFFASYGTRPPKNTLERLLRSTRLGTLALNTLDNLQHGAASIDVPTVTKETTKNLLERLRNTVASTKAKFVVLAIPSPSQLDGNSPEEALFNEIASELGLCVVRVDELSGKDYAPLPDDHWNNEGHHKAFESLTVCLQFILDGDSDVCC